MVAAAQAAGAKVLIIGMELPPNYGPAYAREFEALFADVAKARKVAARAVRSSRASARTSRSSSPTASIRRRRRSRGCSTTSGRTLEPLLRATMIAAAPAAPQGRRRARSPRIADAHRRAQPVGVRRSITSRARSTCPVLDDDERARRRHAARAGRRRSRRSKRRRGARRAQHRAHPRDALPRQAARLGAARLLLARRQAQRLARARAERDRLARRAARRRLPRVSPARRRAARRAAAALSLSRRLRADRLGQEPAARARSPTRARRCSTSKRSRSIAARCWATSPTSRSRRRRRSTAGVLAALERFDAVASGVRRIGEPQDRHRAGAAMRCSRRCARAPCVRARARRSRCASRC